MILADVEHPSPSDGSQLQSPNAYRISGNFHFQIRLYHSDFSLPCWRLLPIKFEARLEFIQVYELSFSPSCQVLGFTYGLFGVDWIERLAIGPIIPQKRVERDNT